MTRLGWETTPSALVEKSDPLALRTNEQPHCHVGRVDWAGFGGMGVASRLVASLAWRFSRWLARRYSTVVVAHFCLPFQGCHLRIQQQWGSACSRSLDTPILDRPHKHANNARPPRGERESAHSIRTNGDNVVLRHTVVDRNEEDRHVPTQLRVATTKRLLEQRLENIYPGGQPKASPLSARCNTLPLATFIRITGISAGRGGRDAVLEDGRVPRRRRKEIHEGLGDTQRREEPHHGDAFRQRGGTTRCHGARSAHT